jgi:type II secretory pathway predicted ATPase ExeA
MYLEHFGLQDQPFRLTPDSRFLYLSEAHAQAKAYMEYTIWNRDSFVIITGEIGSGKTTLIQKVLEELDQDVVVAKIHQTQLAEVQFLQALLAEFGVEAYNARKVQLLKMLNRYLEEQNRGGRRVVLVVDEAQNLSPRVLEEIRLLSGLETDREASLNVILCGQPELAKTLDGEGMEQLAQRVRLRFHLEALAESEMQDYIDHRLHMAGLALDRKIFPPELMAKIYEYTNGIPRLVNTLCDTALTCAFVEELDDVTGEALDAAIKELRWETFAKRMRAKKKRSSRERAAPPPPGQIAKLVLREDKEVIGEYLLHKESMTIGRNPDNDICIDDSVVSSYHARILTQRDSSYVYDLNSTNGTFVNSRPIKKHRVLKDGDVITITKYQIKYTVFDSTEEGLAGDGTVVGDANGSTGQRKMWRDTIDTRTLSS